MYKTLSFIAYKNIVPFSAIYLFLICGKTIKYILRQWNSVVDGVLIVVKEFINRRTQTITICVKQSNQDQISSVYSLHANCKFHVKVQVLSL